MELRDMSNEELGKMIRWAIENHTDFVYYEGDTYSLADCDIITLHKKYTKYNNRFIPTDADEGKIVDFVLDGKHMTGMLIGADSTRFYIKYKSKINTGWTTTWKDEARLLEARR